MHLLNRIPKIVLAIGLLVLWLLLSLANSEPSRFANPDNLVLVLLFELLFASIFLYRRFFFLMIIVTFLLAGMNLPIAGGIWTIARWGVLGLGGFVGLNLMVKNNPRNFNMFHIIALLAILTALMSAAVSPFGSVALLKAASLFILFLYGATGARLAVMGRQKRFFFGLLIGCEVFVGSTAMLYLVGIEAMGNPNSLGAVMGVAAAPILLWGMLIAQTQISYWRRAFLYSLAMYLTFTSQARAGILAAVVSSVVMCVALKKYRLLAKGFVFVLVIAAIIGISRPEFLAQLTTDFQSQVLYKGSNSELGVLSSRASPWQDSLASINNHFWFGTGFGTSDTGQDPTANLGKFASNMKLTEEHGSSYLAIMSWVGMAGILPFVLLLLALVRVIFQSIFWMYRTGDAGWGFVPLSIVILGGLVHAGFEDWLFAPGYYLCVFFWSCAFILIDEFLLANSYFSRSSYGATWSGRQLQYRAPL